jgi:hypothetical protein
LSIKEHPFNVAGRVIDEDLDAWFLHPSLRSTGFSLYRRIDNPGTSIGCGQFPSAHFSALPCVSANAAIVVQADF